MSRGYWRATRGVNGAWYVAKYAENGFQLALSWGPFDSEPEAKEVCAVRNAFAEKAALRGAAPEAPRTD